MASDQLWRCSKCKWEYRPAINCIEVACPHHPTPLVMEPVEGWIPPLTTTLQKQANAKRLVEFNRQQREAQKSKPEPGIRRVPRRVT